MAPPSGPLIQVGSTLGRPPERPTPRKEFVGIPPDDAAFRWWLEFDCPPRRQQPWARLLLSGDALRTSRSLVGHADLDPAEHRQLQQRAELAQQQAADCAPCPANLFAHSTGTPSPIGCSGAIAYPLSAAADQALALSIEFVLRQRLGGPAVALLSLILDNQLRPERIAHLRHQTAPRFFESAQPLELALSTTVGDVALTTDHLWEVLLGFRVDPRYAAAAYVPYFDLLEGALAAAPHEVVGPLRDDRTVVGLRFLGNAYRLAAALKVDVVTLL